MDSYTALTAVQIVLLGTVVAGATELISRLRARDFWVAVTIATSALLGGLIGLHYGVDFIDGISVGLGASGAIATVGSLGKKSTPTESKAL